MKSQSSNKSFGLLFFIIFLIIGLWPLKNGESINFYFITASIIFLLLGLINSKLLTPLNKSWIKLGEPFRRDAMKKPVKVAGINKKDMRPQKSLNG